MEQIRDLCQEKIQKLVNICNQLSIGYHFEANELEFARFNEGLVSEIYRIDFKNSIIIDAKKIKRVVVKLFSQNPPYDLHKSKINSIIIGLEKLGPKVYLSNDDVLVLQYFNGRSFTHKDDLDENLVQLLIRKLARFHALYVPINKNTYLDQVKYVFEGWIDEKNWIEIYNGPMRESLKKNNCINLIKNNIQIESLFLEKNILALEPNLVFAHQDLNHSNIFLINDISSQPDIKFIDFDFSGYNFRAMDIGKYFSVCERTEQFGIGNIIRDEKMLRIIQYYIDENCLIYGEHYRTDPRNSPEILLKESKIFVLFALIVEIFFCLWRAVNLPENRDQYCIFAEKRYKSYLNFKKRIQNENILT